MDRVKSPKLAHRSRTDYSIACLAPLSVELAPLQAMLDALHEDIPTTNRYRRNAYILGELKQHNIVIAPLPSIGNNDSGVVASQLLHDFPSIQFGLLVGIAGGVPGLQDGNGNDIRLGDVVVSEPKGTLGGVVQFDRGKNLQGDRLQVIGHLNKPPAILITTVKKLAAQHQQDGHNNIPRLISEMLSRNPSMKDRFQYPGPDRDSLFESDYEHVAGHTCLECDRKRIIQRGRRPYGEVVVHYGTIGSSNAVLKNAIERDRLGLEYGLLSVEMEAAGLMDTLPCLVIRGICDYADSHKNKEWQPYAAAAAAAYTKELLSSISSVSASVTVEVPDTNVENLAVDHQYKRSRNPSERLLESLTFDRMDTRRWNIQEPLPYTCEWIFQHQAFRSWMELQGQFLWIKGKPGSGKSTLMKTVLQWTDDHWRSDTSVSYFFNARAPTALENSTLGLYRSITYQLLKVNPDLKMMFSEIFDSKAKSGLPISWSVPELTNFWIRIIRGPHHLHKTINIFIDALDEGKDVRQLVWFLEDIVSAARSNRKLLRVYLSSRHYPNISTKSSFDLIMEDQVGQKEDIRRFVDDRLVGEQSSEFDLLTVEICRKTAGIFLWAVLVVPILNTIYDDGGSVPDMLQSLKSIPIELSDLFSELLETFSNDSDREECLTLLQWVLFSKWALTPEQLYLAIQATLSRPRANCGGMSIERLKRYLLHKSRGLIEITRLNPPTVQFIHETARDFFKFDGLSQMSSNLAGNVTGQCHEKLKLGCERYIGRTPSIEITAHMSLHELWIYEREIMHQNPLLKYAGAALMWHAEVAASSGIAQRDFMAQYSDRDRTIFEQWVRVYCLSTNRDRWNPATAHVLELMIDQGLEILASELVKVSADIGSEKASLDRIFAIAFRYGSEQLVRLSVERGADVTTLLENNWETFLRFIGSHNDRMICLLLESGIDIKTQSEKFGEAIELACKCGHDGMVRLLIENGVSVNPTDRRGHSSPLALACAKGYEHIVRLLIDSGADVNFPEASGKSALWTACYEGHVPIVCLLIDSGADANFRGVMVSNILQTACNRGQEEIVRLLLEGGADVNCSGGSGGTALQRACFHGYDEIVRHLIEFGADLDTFGGDGGNCIQVACENGHEEIARLLIDFGVDVNAYGGDKASALQIACENGYEEIVYLLIMGGADVNALVRIRTGNDINVDAQGEYFWTALIAACAEGFERIVWLLIDSGADVNASVRVPAADGVGIDAHGDYFCNALLIACAQGHEETVRILVARGADVNASGGDLGSALVAACVEGHGNIVRFLLDNGADMNVRCRKYGSVVEAVGHNEQIARLLIESGADFNVRREGSDSALEMTQARTPGSHLNNTT